LLIRLAIQLGEQFEQVDACPAADVKDFARHFFGESLRSLQIGLDNISNRHEIARLFAIAKYRRRLTSQKLGAKILRSRPNKAN